MTPKRGWDDFRAWLWDDPALGTRLDVSRMGLGDDALDLSRAALARAFGEMKALEEGAIANPDEERRVGHYWLRNPDLAPTPEIASAIRRTRDAVERFAADVHRGAIRPERTDRFSELLVVGIGGSALGPQLVADALGSSGDRMTPHFLDNTDPDGFDRLLGSLAPRLDRTLTVVISKSGGTPETRNGMIETANVYAARGLRLGRHAVAITGEDSTLDRHAVREEFLARFPMWDWVGGRTSVTSAVGLLPMALQGLDVASFLDGAARMDAATRVPRAEENPAALLALAWHHAGDGRGRKDMVVLPYKDRLALLSRYLQQLVMESLGKRLDRDGNVVHQGIAVYGNKGSTDQHAYVQQLREGVANFFVTFIQVLRDRAGAEIEVEPGVTSGDFLHGFLLGTRRALEDAGRPSLTITVREWNAASLGQLIALFERAVGLYASWIGVNAYHQPGVEAGKKAAADVLELQRRVLVTLDAAGNAGATAERIARQLGSAGETETIFWILEHLAANPAKRVARAEGATPFDATYCRVLT